MTKKVIGYSYAKCLEESKLNNLFYQYGGTWKSKKDRNIKIMCGRYVLYSKEKFKNKYNININPNYNISPNQEVFVIDQNMNIMKLKWGIKAEWKKCVNH